MKSLYTRILLAFWTVMLLIVLGAVGLTWFALADRSDEAPRAASELIRTAAVALRDGGEPGLVAWVKSAQATHPELRVLAIDASGRELLGRPLPTIIGRLLRAPRGDLPELPGLTVLPARPLPQLETVDGRRYSVLVLPPRPTGGPLGPSPARWPELLLALAVTGVASLIVTRSITLPVRALGAATRDLASGNLDVRVERAVSARRDEFGTLARDFDAMAARLRELLQGRERLLRDVSHELRSPLARMQVALGLARQPGSDAARHLERLDVEIGRLDRLIGQVLSLSRLDAGARAPPGSDVDLVELIDAIARDAAFEGQSRGVAIDWQPPGAAVLVRGDPLLLASAIENVVRNAVGYTAAGSGVSIALAQAPEYAEIVVRDHGPGVPDGELMQIFEPFHRVQESRTRDSGGDGIGLAITSRVLAAHGGRAAAANAPGGGLWS